MTMMNDITTIIRIRIYSNNLNNHMHNHELSHHAPYFMCEDHTVTCHIPRTRSFEWISNSAELIHFTHKLEPLNIART
jgi:hypothetical protein